MAIRARRDGFTLIEVLVVIAIAGIFTVLAVPPTDSMGDHARDVRAATSLRAVLSAELKYFDAHGAFTVNRSELRRIKPGLPLGPEGEPGSVYIVVAISRSNPAVCLFTAGALGWHTVYHSERSGTATRVGGPADCTRRMLEEQRSPQRFAPRRTRSNPATGRTRGTG